MHPVYTPPCVDHSSHTKRRDRNKQFDLFSRSLDISCTARVPGRSQTEKPLQATQTHTVQHRGEWPLYLGLSPSLAALSSENVSPSYSSSLLFLPLCPGDKRFIQHRGRKNNVRPHCNTNVTSVQVLVFGACRQCLTSRSAAPQQCSP